MSLPAKIKSFMKLLINMSIFASGRREEKIGIGEEVEMREKERERKREKERWTERQKEREIDRERERVVRCEQM